MHLTYGTFAFDGAVLAQGMRDFLWALPEHGGANWGVIIDAVCVCVVVACEGVCVWVSVFFAAYFRGVFSLSDLSFNPCSTLSANNTPILKHMLSLAASLFLPLSLSLALSLSLSLSLFLSLSLSFSLSALRSSRPMVRRA